MRRGKGKNAGSRREAKNGFQENRARGFMMAG